MKGNRSKTFAPLRRGMNPIDRYLKEDPEDDTYKIIKEATKLAKSVSSQVGNIEKKFTCLLSDHLALGDSYGPKCN